MAQFTEFIAANGQFRPKARGLTCKSADRAIINVADAPPRGSSRSHCRLRRVLVAVPHCPPVGAPMHAGNASSAKWLPHSGIRTV
jgi:hypothetical protein